MDLAAHYCIGRGPVVVLLHSTLSSKNQWKALSSMLHSEYRVIAVDLYGYGATPMPEKTESFTLLDEAILVQSLLDKLLLPDEPIHLVGHSYGGAVALCFCHHFPRRVKTLAVFEPVSFHLLDQDDPVLEPILALMRQIARLMAAGLREEAAAYFLDYWSDQGSFANFPLRLQKEFALRTKKLALDFTALMQTHLTLAEYRELRLPVTVMAGKWSRPPALRVVQKLYEALPDCTLREVDTGHLGPVTDPELVNPIIRASLA